MATPSFHLHSGADEKTPEIVPCIYKENTRCSHLQCVVVELTRGIAALRETIAELTDVVRGWR